APPTSLPACPTNRTPGPRITDGSFRSTRARVRSSLRRRVIGDPAMNRTIDPDLVRLLKRLKLGPLLPTLPERLALARAQHLDYTAFLTLLLADQVQRRDQQALERHLLQAGFEDRVSLDGFDWTSPVQLDRRQLQPVFTLEFLARKEHCV